MHSTWSDGSQTLEDIIEAGIARGYQFCAVTDHSYGLPDRRRRVDARARRAAPRDRSPERAVRRQVPAAQRHRSQHPGRRLGRHGARRAAPARDRRRGAALGAAVEDRSDRADGQGGADTAASTSSGIPRGRKYGSRPGVTADWDRVFKAAARADVAIEIDGDPVATGHRLRPRARERVRGRMPVRARQRRACDRRVELCRNRHRAREAGWRAAPIASSIAGRSSGCSNGCGGSHDAVLKGLSLFSHALKRLRSDQACPTQSVLAGELAMIESRRAIELCHDRRQLRSEAPFVRPAPR